ncbi:MAG: hypothetical protein A3F16_08340 [Deltaproteobacteria bacterium RIFCSPHIGHO2_12_FULL_43_9]|nr:MAG: hypothetical protein A3F16_08340 [Deltaproteobacteria bacterium RIFCSPHIGHO2_12_FULL_43_9]
MTFATIGCSAKTEPEKFPKVMHSIPMTGITQGTGGATGTAMIVIPSHFASADITIPTATAEDPIETALCIQSGENEECSAPFTVNSGNSTRLLLDFSLGMAELIRTTGLVSLYVVDFVTRLVIISANINQGTPSDRIPAEFSEPQVPDAPPAQ